MKFERFLVCCGALQATLVTAPFAWAQTPPVAPPTPFNIGPALRQSEEAARPPLQAAPAAPVLPRLVEPELKLKGNETLFIRTFKLEGPDLGAGEEVQEILAPYQNRKLNLAAIYEAADTVTTLLRNKGYMLSKAYVPAQDARRGVLVLKIVPGNYGTIMVRNQSHVADPFVRDAIEQARSASPVVRKDDIERVMLLTSDLAGAGLPKIAIGSGQQPGTSDFVFDVPEARRFDGYVLYDNFGAPWTGRSETSGAVNINSPFGMGDKISAFGMISEAKGLVNGRLTYSLPIGVSGLKTEIGIFRTTYALGGIYGDLDATGTADGLTATLAYALKRQTDESYVISGNFTHKSVIDNALGVSLNNRTINLGTATLNRDTAGSLFGLPLTTNASLSFTAGSVEFPDAGAILNPAIGGDYSRVNLSYLATLGLTDKLSLSTNIRGQKALNGKSLDSSEQFYLTGFFGVRSFDQGFGGDSGYLVTPELKYALPEFPDILAGYHHSVGLFTDVGGAQLENPQFSVTQKAFTQLNDVGLGYYSTYEYLPNRFVTLKAYLAHSYGSTGGAEQYNKETKGLVQVGFTF
jgi:hemolysin activation/secretion protein